MPNFRKVILKVPVDLRDILFKILKHVQSTIKFEELTSFIATKYNLKLELFTSNDNEVVLVVTDENKQKFSESTRVQYTKEEIEKFKHILDRIDFRDILKGVLKPLMVPTYSTEYVEIQILIKNEDEIERCSKNFFDCYPWKVNNIHTVFIGHIYDPSKFWIRFLCVDEFQNHLWNFYEGNGILMDPKDVRVGLDCVVFIADVYYRGKIVRTDIKDPKSFRVFLRDYGTVSKVAVSQLFLLDDSFAKFPAFAVRAMLSNVSTVDEKMWPESSITKFKELTDDKNLFAEIVSIHKKRKILEINLYDKGITKKDKVLSVNCRLVREGFAKVAWYAPSDEVHNNSWDNSLYKPIRDFLYLFPPFEIIECGATPSIAHSIEELKQCVPWDVVFPDLYKYESTEIKSYNK